MKKEEDAESTTINLDEARAARREAQGGAPTIVFGGQRFELPVELPFEAAGDISRLAESQDDQDPTKQAGASDALLGLTKTLLGADFEKFMTLRPSLADIGQMIEGTFKAYGLSAGEPPASTDS